MMQEGRPDRLPGGLAQKILDICHTRINHGRIALGDQGWRLAQAQRLCLVHVLRYIPLFEGNAGFLQQRPDYPAARAGGCGIEIILFRGLFRRFPFRAWGKLFPRILRQISLPIQIFLALAVVPVLYRAVVAGDAAV